MGGGICLCLVWWFYFRFVIFSPSCSHPEPCIERLAQSVILPFFKVFLSSILNPNLPQYVSTLWWSMGPFIMFITCLVHILAFCSFFPCNWLIFYTSSKRSPAAQYIQWNWKLPEKLPKSNILLTSRPFCNVTAQHLPCVSESSTALKDATQWLPWGSSSQNICYHLRSVNIAVMYTGIVVQVYYKYKYTTLLLV